MVAVLVALGGLVRPHASRLEPAEASARAIEMLRSGHEAAAWPLLRQAADNTARSLLIRDIARM